MIQRKHYTLQLPARSIGLGSKSCIMGILNLTPDSFYDGGRFSRLDQAMERVQQMAYEGAEIIDIGAESTRPGAESVTAEEEIKRLTPVVKRLKEEITLPLSIDTYKAKTAQAMLGLGVEIINDISGLRFDPEMPKVIAEYKAAVILMHIQGTPRDMQQNPSYHCLLPEVIDYLRKSINMALEAGIAPDRIVIDPGLGFGKTMEHNLQIIQQLGELQALDKPILLGPSRKSFIGKVLDCKPEERLEGTAAVVAVSIMNGAHIVRVHDVQAMSRVGRMTDAVLNA